MKKFKYEIYLPVTQDEAKALEKPLDELGYNTEDINDACENLVTNYLGKGSDFVGRVGSQARARYKCKSAAEFLALAAMVDSDEIYKGESVVWTYPNHSFLTVGKIYQVCKDSDDAWVYVVDDTGKKYGGCKKYFRKATKEEISAQYAPKGIDVESAKSNFEEGGNVKADRDTWGEYTTTIAEGILAPGSFSMFKLDLSKPSKDEGWYADTRISDIKSPVGLNWIAQRIAPDWLADNVVYTFDQSQFCTGQEAVVHISRKKSSTRKLLVF